MTTKGSLDDKTVETPLEKVIVLHGILRTHKSMGGLARFIKENGYDVLNINYPSTKHTIQELVEVVRPQIEAFTAPSSTTVHLIGYSMGGLIIRGYLSLYRPHQLGRVVMIGTPNGGSEVADLLKDFGLFRRVFGASGQQLTTDQRDLVESFGPTDYELGIIAGSSTINPVGSKIIGKPSDGTVSVESTKVDGMRAHIVIPGSHTLLPNNRTAWQHCLSFLKNGAFSSNEEARSELSRR